MMVADNGPRSHHPADIRKPPEPVVRLMVESQVDFFRHLSQTSGMRVYRAFGFPGRARSVKNESFVFGIERKAFTLHRLAANNVIPPEVSSFRPRHWPSFVTPHDHFFDGADFLLQWK